MKLLMLRLGAFFDQTPKTRPESPTKTASRSEGDRPARRVRVPSQQAAAALASPTDRLLVQRPHLSGPPESSFGSLIIQSTNAEHQKLHIFPFLAFLEP